MIDAYLKDKVLLKIAYTDKWGTKTFQQTEPVKCRITYKNRLVTTLTGEQVVAAAEILMNTRPLSQEDLINFDGQDHKILQIGKEGHFHNTHMLIKVA